MFLTTNRVGAFDKAFKSRIHLAIRYPELSPESRRELWQTFIKSGSAGKAPQWMDGSFLDKIATKDVNGRQIKNIVRTAFALAFSLEVPISPIHIVKGLKALKSFDAEFAEEAPMEGCYEEPVAKRLRSS